jgi:hypothetical protein
MAWKDISDLFRDTVTGDIPDAAIGKVTDLISRLDRDSNVRDITAAFVAPAATRG